MKPLISIVVPNLNVAQFLGRTLESIVSQNYPNLELIMVDGGSVDGSLEIIERYLPHFSKLIVGPDSGQGDALNKGFAHANGDILAWVNSDDILMPGALDNVATVFSEFPKVSWITGKLTLIDEADNIIKQNAPRSLTRARFFAGDYKWIQQESTFWRRELWQQAGGQLDDSFRLAIDGDLWLRFFRYECLYPVDVALGAFRIRTGQRSEAMDAYHAEMLKAIARERDIASPAFKKFYQNLLALPVAVRSRDEAAKIPKVSHEDVKPITQSSSGGVRFLNPNGPLTPAMNRRDQVQKSQRTLRSKPQVPAPAKSALPADDLRRFRGIHAGQRCFIMGNGPSLNSMDLSLLENEIVFAANSIYLIFDRIAWRPRYYACVDTRVLPDTASEIMAMHEQNPDMELFFPNQLSIYDGTGRKLDTRGIISPGRNRSFFRQVNMDPARLPYSAFSLNADDFLVTPNTVTITLMQLAAYMGFSDIFLIGCDTSYVVPSTVQQDGPAAGDGTGLFLTSTADDDPNHFDPRYFGRNRKWHAPKVNDMIFHYEQAREVLTEAGIRVYNATVGGRLEVFKRVDYKKVFRLSISSAVLQENAESLCSYRSFENPVVAKNPAGFLEVDQFLEYAELAPQLFLLTCTSMMLLDRSAFEIKMADDPRLAGTIDRCLAATHNEDRAKLQFLAVRRFFG